MNMKTKKLEEVIIKKPLTEKQVREFDKIYLKGIFRFNNPPRINESEYSAEYIEGNLWGLDGYEKHTENGRTYRVDFNSHPTVKEIGNRTSRYDDDFGTQIHTQDLVWEINELLKQNGGIIIGYKSAEKMKGHSHKAPSKRNYNIFGNIKGLENSVKKIF